MGGVAGEHHHHRFLGNAHIHTPHFQWHIFIAILGGIGMAIIYGCKVNLSVAMVAMVNRTAFEEDISAHSNMMPSSIEQEVDLLLLNGTMAPNHTTVEQGEITICQPSSDGDENTDGTGGNKDGPLLWDTNQYSLTIGSYFWGYIVSQIPAGRIAEVGSAKWIFFAAVLMNVVALLLTPVAAYAGYIYLVVLRVIEGLGGGITFPAINVIISKWAPINQRSIFSSIVFGGTALGTVISLVTAGQIAQNLGWEYVFYIHGGLPLVWCIFWAIFVTDDPKDHKFVTEAEMEEINEGRVSSSGNGKKSLPIPWRAIFTSPPVYAIIVAHTLNNFGWYMLLVELPIFLGNGIGFDLSNNSLLSALPFLMNWVFTIIYSNILDFSKSKGLVTSTTALKLSMLIASIIPAICLILVTLSGCNKTGVVVFMVIGLTFYGSMFSGVFSNHVAIANNFSGLLMGISNTFATIPGVVVPAFIGAITHGTPGLEPWHLAFYVCAGVLILEAIVYTVFASGEEQPWNRPGYVHGVKQGQERGAGDEGGTEMETKKLEVDAENGGVSKQNEIPT